MQITKRQITDDIKLNGIDNMSINIEDVKIVYQLPDINNNEILKALEYKIQFNNHRMIKTMQEIGESFNFINFLKYKEWRKDHSSDSSSLGFFEMKYGKEIGKIKHKEKLMKSSQSKENLILRYGEVEGLKRYNKNCKTNAGNHTLERRQKLHGKEEGLRLFLETERKLKNKNTLEYHIKLYGEEEGPTKYYDRYERRSNTIKNNNSLKSEEDLRQLYDHGSKEYYLEKHGNLLEYYNKSEKISQGVKLSLDGLSPEELQLRCDSSSKKSFFRREGTLENYYKKQKKRRVTEEINGNWLPLSEWRDYRIYSTSVRKLTKEQELSTLPDINKRGNGFHLDHKYSIFEGFKNNIPIHIIGDISNLEILSQKANCKKGGTCSIDIKTLMVNFK